MSQTLSVLFIGDIFGKPGRQALKQYLPLQRQQQRYDAVIANCENAAGGNGMTLELYKEFKQLGIDALTSGNHIWDKKEFLAQVDQCPDLLRPANYSSLQPGRGWMTITLVGGQKIALINLAGRVFMGPANDPFATVDQILEEIQQTHSFQRIPVIVDLHAETSSEKTCMAWHLDGRVSALLGTHTHVQTADERIFPQGLGFITDVGMCGPRDGVIGVDAQQALYGMRSGMKQKFEPAAGALQFNACYIEIDAETGHCSSIQRIKLQ